MHLCPCCSNKMYTSCCEPYITTQKFPNTPEKLMRSRYTAFTIANIKYIKKTMKYQALDNFNETETKNWAMRVVWQNLKVIDSRMENPNVGYVEFIASFIDNGKLQKIHELSKFIKENNIWYYVSGVHFAS